MTIYDDEKNISPRNNKELDSIMDKYGYKYVHLHNKDGIDKKFILNKLVAIYFLVKSKSSEILIIDHINDIKTDIRVCNLRWIT